MSQIFCPKCKKTLEEGNFYTYKDGTKCEQCKKCQTMHIDNYNPETFLWLLEKMDVPYIAEEWNTLRDRAAQKANADHKPLTGMSVYGKYLSKMKLKQWQGYTWADSEKLRAERDLKMQHSIEQGKIPTADHLKEMLDDGEISQAEYDTLSEEPVTVAPQEQYYPAGPTGYEVVELVDVGADLTDEDKKYLAMKWGRLYRPDQWVILEKFYSEMAQSFDIQGAAREDTMKKICKTSLKMDEAIDCGDIDSFQKLSRVYDALMKSGKFTEAQNKSDDKSFVNSIGELVAICEREGGFIPQYITDVPQDVIDITIKDMNRYTYNLVTKDMGLGQQIEDALKKIQIQKEIEEDEATSLSADLDSIEQSVLEDVDLENFYNNIEEQKMIDDGIEGEEI